MIAGLLLCARSHGAQHGLKLPSADEILRATGATRSRAYEIAHQIGELLPTLARDPGRPRIERTSAPAVDTAALRAEVLRFVMTRPGCVQRHDKRGRYSDAFRLFVIGLRERHADLPLTDFADALEVPLGTVEDWLRAPRLPATQSDDEPSEQDTAREQDAKLAQMETVLVAWRAWSGDFTSFCDHVRRDHRLDLGNTMIGNILFAHGARTPSRRGGRSRDERALRGAFETFFPGAQWIADGKGLDILIDGKRFRVNLELAVDAATDAAVGISVRDEEDSQAVVDALDNGVQTTGQAPLAALLDNRPSNHTPEVDAALGDTMRIRATLGRPQNKAHVEGAFGLFAQKVPPLAIDTRDPRALARQIALIVAVVFFRALNRAPRRDRDGKTRVDLYAQHVTPEQREAAHAALRERMRKQELARQTRAARLDPIVRALLDDAFERLGLLDPDRHLRDAIACYPRDAIVDAIAIFAGKRERGTLPAGADARYLLGIARNLHHLHEADAITAALLRERLVARDRFLEQLVHDCDAISAATADVESTLDAFIDRLVRAERTIDRHYWIDAAAHLLAPIDDSKRHVLARRACRRIHAAFRLPRPDRALLERLLLRRLWPLD